MILKAVAFETILVTFDFDEKLTQNFHVIPKTSFAHMLWLIKCFQIKILIWKTKECLVSINIELKIWQ